MEVMLQRWRDAYFKGISLSLSPCLDLLSTEHCLCVPPLLNLESSSLCFLLSALSRLRLLALSCHYLSPLLICLYNWIFSVALSAGLDESPLKTTEFFLLTVGRYCCKEETLRITKLNCSFLPADWGWVKQLLFMFPTGFSFSDSMKLEQTISAPFLKDKDVQIPRESTKWSFAGSIYWEVNLLTSLWILKITWEKCG